MNEDHHATLNQSKTARAKRVVISRNPKSGSSDSSQLVQILAEKLSQAGLEVEVLTDIDEVVATVTKHLSELKAVVSAGGDGTISLLANCLPNGTPLAILPLGTENLLAKHLGIKADPQLVCDMICRGRTARLDAGRANGKLFLVMASCGFDADVVQRVHASRTGHIRHWSYAIPVIRSIRKYRYPTLRITVDDGEKKVKSKWAFIFNVPRYAMNLPIAADANPSDGILNLCTFRGGSLFRGLYYLFTVVVRQHKRWTNSQQHRFKKLTIESDESVPFQLDGDPGGHLPLEVEILPKFLNLLVPSTYNGG